MTWLTLSLALAVAGLTYKWLRTKNGKDKAELFLKLERKKTALQMANYKDLKTRADERIKQLKGRVNELLEASIENSKPGDMLDALNSLNGLHEDSDG